MKQGRASSSGPGGRKIEPKATAMSPAGVSQIGEAIAKNPHSMHAGRGMKSPEPSGKQVHKHGSQGKR